MLSRYVAPQSLLRAIDRLPSIASARTPADNTAAPTFAPAHGATVTDVGGSITLTFAGAIRKDGSGADFTGHADLAAVLTVIVPLALVLAAALPQGSGR